MWAELFNIPYERPALDEHFNIVAEDYYKENGGVIIANPNAPTGIEQNEAFLRDVIEHNQDVVVIIDEAYVDFSEKDRAALIALYAKTAKREEFVKVVPFAAVQRLCQCLGAYGRLASVGQPQFKRHVVPALRNLLVAADEAGLDAVGALAEDLLGREMKNSR